MAEFYRNTVDILIMAHGYLYVDEYDNPITFGSEATTVITVAPPSLTSWSNPDVESNLIELLNRDLTDPELANQSFEDIVAKTIPESGVMKVLERNQKYKHTKYLTVRKNTEIANKLIDFDDSKNPDGPDPNYGIWYLDDPQGPIDLLKTSLKFPKINGEMKMHLSGIVETLIGLFPTNQINILDYTCNSCLLPTGEVVKYGTPRLMRRLARRSRHLHLFSFKSPTSWAEMNETSAADCASSMRNGVMPTTTKRKPGSSNSNRETSILETRSHSPTKTKKKRKRGPSSRGGRSNSKSRKRR